MVFAELKQTGKRLVIKANYHLGNYKDVVWLAGDGRSGTTWVSNLVNWHGQYREMFEPFHPELIAELRAAKLHQYLKPNDVDNELSSILRSIFSGEFYHPRPDALNRRFLYKGLLVKDIFANLLIGWVNQQLPHIKKVLVIRNPFAVALSKQKRVRGLWMKNPRDFLLQPSLIEDYLSPFEGLIKRVGGSFLERQLMIWAIIHYVPLQQMRDRQINQSDVYILFYENLFAQPREEVRKLFEYLFEREIPTMNEKLLAKIERPSRSPGKDSNIMLGKSPVDSWRNEISAQQLEQGVRLLENFGLHELYGSSSTPHEEALLKLLEPLR
ncbi:MAG: sulfotransferase domain-containing protein [Cyanobacteria bacterium J06623_5]